MAINIEERRRRRDERRAGAQQPPPEAPPPAEEPAAGPDGITLQWAGIAAMVAAAIALALAARHRDLPLVLVGCGAWTGAVMGGLLCDAGLQRGSARLTHLALAIFAGLPVSVIPYYFVSAERSEWPLVAVAGLGGALFGAAVRLAWDIRQSAGSLPDSLARAREGLGGAISAAITWLHDAMLKWILSLLLLALGGGVAFVGRQQHRELLFWAGFTSVCMIGATGLRMPGLTRRTPLPVALRHVGQLAFWLAFLVVPFVELGPDGTLPYSAEPSLRFAVMGVGLVIVGVTWYLQRGSIVGQQQPRPEPKRRPERVLSLAVVLLGLGVSVLGVDIRQRMRLAVDQNVVSESNLLGAVHFERSSQVKSLTIVQPLENVPIYLDYVNFDDGSSLRLIPLLYPGEQLRASDAALVKAVRTAAQLNVQFFPERRVEQWSKS
jgi:hypothetical protein